MESERCREDDEKKMKVMVLGVLGNFGYREMPYVINNKKHTYTNKSRLPSAFITDYYRERGDNVYYVLLIPESLITNVVNYREAYESLVKNDVTKILVDKLNESEVLGEVETNEIRVLPSIGRYSGNNYHVNFINNISNIRAEISIYLIKNAGFEDYDKVILDISTGHNLYVRIFLDSFRDFIVNTKLGILLDEEKKKVITCIAEVPPVIGSVRSEEKPFPISFREYDVKAFFDFPLKDGKLPDIGKIVNNPRIIDKYKEENRKFRRYIHTYYLAYKAIKYNTLLVLMDKNILDISMPKNGLLKTMVEFYERVLKDIYLHRKVVKEEDGISVEYDSVNIRNLVNALHSAAFSEALYDFYIK